MAMDIGEFCCRLLRVETGTTARKTLLVHGRPNINVEAHVRADEEAWERVAGKFACVCFASTAIPQGQYYFVRDPPASLGP